MTNVTHEQVRALAHHIGQRHGTLRDELTDQIGSLRAEVATLNTPSRR